MLHLRKLSLALGSAALALGTAGQLSAATITFYDNPGTLTGQRGTLSCTNAGCGFEALLASPGSYSSHKGGIFTVHPPNETNQTAFVNDNRKSGDAAFSVPDADKTENAPSSFSSSALYVLLKIGGGDDFQSLLIRNTSGTVLDLTWAGFTGPSTAEPRTGRGRDKSDKDDEKVTGSGLSHYTEFGSLPPPPPTPAIPVPAAGWLLLGGLGALGAMARARRPG